LAGVKRSALLGVAAALLGATTLHAQAVPSGPGPNVSEEAPPERPGLFQVGTFYLTPYLRIGSMGIDTNVFYTATDRQIDFTASGGPGLEIVRPFGEKSKFRLDGGLDYLYFAKTDSQRKLNGYGSALLQVEGTKTRLLMEEAYTATFQRPSYEVNARVQQEREGTQLSLRRNLGDRFALALYGSRQRMRTDSYDYLGTDVGQTMTENDYQASAELRLALSVKTQLVGGGEQDWYRFPLEPERDGEAQLAYGGFRTDNTALIAGHALAGYRWFRLDSGNRQDSFYADVDAVWNISFKTKLGARYVKDIAYSAFDTSGPTPTDRTEGGEVYLDKTLVSNVYFRVFGRWSRFVTNGEITIYPPEGEPTTGVRDDRVREGGVEIGYQFRPRVRIGVTASYTTRTSTFETFGIQGLLAGLTVQYNPPQPSFR
jgi:hypothetical protein